VELRCLVCDINPDRKLIPCGNPQAIDQLQKTLEIEPNFWIGQLLLGKSYERAGQYEEALEDSLSLTLQKYWPQFVIATLRFAASSKAHDWIRFRIQSASSSSEITPSARFKKVRNLSS
jgi:tetratricopeptide (TPR) repeat protein